HIRPAVPLRDAALRDGESFAAADAQDPRYLPAADSVADEGVAEAREPRQIIDIVGLETMGGVIGVGPAIRPRVVELLNVDRGIRPVVSADVSARDPQSLAPRVVSVKRQVPREALA